MPDLIGAATGVISLDVKPALAALSQFAEASKAAGESSQKSLSGTGSSLKSVGVGLTAAGASLLTFVGILGGSAISSAEKYQATMEGIHTQAHATQGEVDAMSKSLLGLSGQVGTGPEQLAEALYHVESAGFRGQQALDAVKIAAEGAKVGGANLVDVTNALNAVLVAGVPEAKNMSGAMGELNAIVGAGDMHMQDLADAMGTGVLATAKAFGLGLQDVGGALAVFGDNNIRGADAATKLRQAIALMGAPSVTAAKALADVGISSTELGDDMRSGGLIKALEDLQAHLKASGLTASQQADVLSRAFGGGRTSSAILILLEQIDRLKNKTGEIGDAAGQFGADWAATTDTAAFKIAQFRATLDSLKTAIGLGLLPIVKSFLGTITPVVQGLADWAAAHQRLAGLIVAGVAAFGALLTVVGLGILLLPVLGGALGALFSPLTLIIGALAVFGAAFAANFGGLRDAVGAALAPVLSLAHYLEIVWQGGTALNVLLSKLPPGLRAFAEAAGNVVTALHTLWGAFQEGGLDNLVAAWHGGAGARLESAAEGLGIQAGKLLLAGLMDGGKAIAAVVPPLLIAGLQTALGALGQAAGAVGDVGQTVFAAVARAFGAIDWRQLATTIGGGLRDAFRAIPWSSIGDLLKTGVTTAIHGLADLGRLILQQVQRVDWASLGLTLLHGFNGAMAALRNLNWQQIGDLIGKGIAELPLLLLRAIALGFQHPEIVLKAIAAVFVAVLDVMGQLALTFAVIGGKLLIGIGQGIIQAAPALWNALVSIISAIPGLFASAGQLLLGPGVALIEGLLSGAESALSSVWDFLSQVGTGVIDAFKDAGSWLLGVGADIIGGLSSGVGAGISDFFGLLQQIPQAVSNFFSNADRWLYNAGWNVITGLWNGIADQWRNFTGWFGNELSNWKNSVTGFLGIHSPSTVFHEIGVDVILGWLNGLKEQAPALQRLMRQIAGSVVEAGQGASTALTPANLTALRAGNGLSPSLLAQSAAAGAASAATRTLNAGGITINVNGAGDPTAVAQKVYQELYGALGRMSATSDGIPA